MMFDTVVVVMDGFIFMAIVPPRRYGMSCHRARLMCMIVGKGKGGRPPHPPGDPGPWSLNAPWVAAPSSRCSPRRYFSTFSLSLFLSNLFFSIKSFILKHSLCVEFVCLYFSRCVVLFDGTPWDRFHWMSMSFDVWW